MLNSSGIATLIWGCALSYIRNVWSPSRNMGRAATQVSSKTTEHSPVSAEGSCPGFNPQVHLRQVSWLLTCHPGPGPRYFKLYEISLEVAFLLFLGLH